LPLAAGCLLLLLTGCETVENYSLTYRLWDNGNLRKWSEPAPDPKLALFEATNRADVLVQYEACSEQHSTVKRRAYFLRQNEARVAAGKPPELVALSAADELKPIPVVDAQSGVANLPPEPHAYAIVNKEGRAFTLYRSLEAETTFDLPVYPETSGTPIRIVLTPFAVAGDTVMVGVVSAVVGFFVWLEMGAPH
jgi:hypothetical protein